MATKFIRAVHKMTGEESELHDEDSPLRLFRALEIENKLNGGTMDDWRFDLVDYQGNRIGEYDWYEVTVCVPLCDLFLQS